MQLNLGCGMKTPREWVNVDYGPGPIIRKIPVVGALSRHFLRFKWNKGIYLHDLRKPLPWASESIEYIYSSHTLEHLTKRDGEKLIAEAYRILLPNGVLRIVVPDLRDAVDGYLQGDRCARDFLVSLGAIDTSNRSLLRRVYGLISGAGHRCMYDEKALSGVMTDAGFLAARMAPFESRIPNIERVETGHRADGALIVEGRKPRTT